MTTRSFYHSFPRPRNLRDSTTQVDGFSVLASIVKNGLLLVPELTKFGDFELIQRRICFTELAESDLPNHAVKFGDYSLEFQINDLRELGGMPTVYIPAESVEDSGLNRAGAKLPALLAQLQQLLGNLKDMRRSNPVLSQAIDLASQGICPIEELYWLPDVFLNLCMPTENVRYTEELGYYRQREWRITHNFVHEGAMIAQPLSEAQKSELVDMNSFFAEEITLKDGRSWRRVDLCMKFDKLGTEHVMHKVQRVFAPAAKIEEVISLLRENGFSTEVCSSGTAEL